MKAAARDTFLRQMAEEARGEDLRDLAPDALNKLAEEFWDWAAGEPAGTRAARIRPVDAGAASRQVLEVIGPDAPFLVASLLGECVAQGHTVAALLHPIVKRSNGDHMSMIQIHLPALSEAESDALLNGAEATLADIHVAVADYAAMRARMKEQAAKVGALTHLDPETKAEAVAFLDWLTEEHFLFLGSRAYVLDADGDGRLLDEEPVMVEGSNLGILRNEALNVLNRGAEPTVLTPEIEAFLKEPDPLIIAKSTLQSRVHRRALADYVGVKQYDETGRVCGEVRFAGLFTSEAYNEGVHSIPVVRQRVAQVLDASGRLTSRHSQKALENILETWPRDELFQTDAETLTPMALGALHLIGQPRTRLFLRYDEFDRYVSAILYVRREVYTSDLRERIGRRLEEALEGEVLLFQPRFDGGPLARVHFHIALNPGHPKPDEAVLEAEISDLAQRWDDAFADALSEAPLSDAARSGASAFKQSFNEAYREAFSPKEAIRDVAELAKLDAARPVRLRAYRKAGDDAVTLRAKIYARDGAIPLSKCVPVLENMGLFVEFETGYPVRPRRKPVEDAPDTYWIHDAVVRRSDNKPIDLDRVETAFAEAFAAVWLGLTDNDGFNRLILSAGLDWREAALLRALCAYRKQTGLDPAAETQIEALVAYPALAQSLIELFRIRFDPSRKHVLKTRAKRAEALLAEIEHKLATVPSLDHDRVLRRLARLIAAVQRTSYYQSDADGSPRRVLAFKIASQELTDLPAPKPYREIFVSSPLVDGVHLRFGPVSRGGLRWSDRRDDFRTEVLGLVKAQQVKNAVIVPTGSKGGFYPKQVPIGASREEVRESGVAAYRAFITALLDVTDNLVDGDVAHPDQTVVWDGEDPYLVVAADKGTATFSDIANEISEAHGFWLGDAFASGGSAGYDHKKMGITARGAWEAVKRHFREMGADVQTEPFTVIGVGDMSGDVFGNGMLLSKQIRLVAAFNHLHIFIDPDPQDPERLWEERKRLFDLPRSSWESYDTSLISEGGGVFERDAKAIPLSPQIRELTGLGGDTATPDELIHALLKAHADLLWFGGIGTYVKASTETHADAGDRSSDAVRIDATELGVMVVGEGANLGLTQAARIEFARAGGRLNTDAIDNSAGVDSSDHEVNIKILLSEAIRGNALPRGERNMLLASMTDEVADKVLAHNYAQTAALTLAEASAKDDHEAHERIMSWLEKRGVLDRAVEGLPATEAMRARAQEDGWLTRPELSVLLAWSKIVLFQDIVASDLPDDPWFEATLRGYFPEPLAGFSDAMDAHRLKREIIATVLANRLLDTGGPAFLLRLRETGADDTVTSARAFEAARALLDLESFSKDVHALDNQAPASLQTRLLQTGADAAGAAAAWIAAEAPRDMVADIIADIGCAMESLRDEAAGVLSPYEHRRAIRRASAYETEGAPKALAERAGLLPLLAFGPVICRLASETSVSALDAGAAFFEVGGALHIDRIRATAVFGMRSAAFWDRMATRRVLNDLLRQQADAARAALQSDGTPKEWVEARHDQIADLSRTLIELAEGRSWSFAKFALAADAVRGFMTANGQARRRDART
ncbi:MAG: NAD-glutamate dehydrogenase [Pseudomonadota bacterium]